VAPQFFTFALIEGLVSPAGSALRVCANASGGGFSCLASFALFLQGLFGQVRTGAFGLNCFSSSGKFLLEPLGFPLMFFPDRTSGKQDEICENNQSEGFLHGFNGTAPAP
jgi:hypothetical protein